MKKPIRPLNKHEDLSLKYIKDKIKKNIFLKNEHFKAGNMVFYSYSPKDYESPFDRNPLILVIWKTNKHILGINFHWAPLILRKKIINYILNKNKENIKRKRPLEINKIMGKTLYRLCKPIFRKYLKKGISRRGAIIPPEEMGYVVNLRAEHFIGISAEDAFKLSLSKLQ